MFIAKVALLAVIQGLAELLPVSSSAHVIVAEKLMGLDPTLPEMTVLLVLLHTGTMLSVLAYFGNHWRKAYFSSMEKAGPFLTQVFLATVATLGLGFVLKEVIEKVLLRHSPDAEVETLFGNLTLMAVSLFAVGLLIVYASSREKDQPQKKGLGAFQSLSIGLVQGLCLPLRGFSRSGATISTGLLLGVAKAKAEDFSFALAVVLTPFVLGKELLRLWRSQDALDPGSFAHLLLPGLAGMALSFVAGLVALKWLSGWLEKGRWNYFGYYCMLFAFIVWGLSLRG